MTRRLLPQRGFTLIEAVVVIVLIGIISTMVAVFIRIPVLGYRDTANRAELTDIADLTLRRMARDLRLALPNSAATYNGGLGIQFLLTKTGGRYLGVADGVGAGQFALDDPAGGNQFTIVSDVPDGAQTIVPNDLIVIGSTGTDIAYDPARSQAATVTGINGNNVTLLTNPFTSLGERISAYRRFFVVSSTVWFQCVPGANGSGTLWRYEASGIAALGAPPAGVTARRLADRVSGCSFTYEQADNIAGAGLAVMTLTLQMPTGDDPPVTLTHQASIQNAP
jgi:MSHA biogenesis protein MshO